VPGISQLIGAAVLSAAHIAPLGGAAHQVLFEILGLAGAIPGMVYLAICVGMLLAMMAYFWRDLFDMGIGIARAAKGKRDRGARLAVQLLVATIPVAAIVFALPFVDFSFPRPTPAIIGAAAVVGGVLLFLLDRMSMTIKRLEHASYVDMIVIALAQVVAYLVPGVSRAGITMMFARALGYERRDAARFSLLLGMPALAGWCLLQVLALARAGDLIWQPRFLAVGGISFFAGLIALAIMMAWLRRHSFAPFAIYRLLIGAVILFFVGRAA
jgi:undecaprenyl-diphosphatase